MDIDIGISPKDRKKIADGLSRIEDEEGVPEATQMIRDLVKGHERVAKTAREVFPSADKVSDESTTDLLTQRLQIHEKTAWMLRSLLEDQGGAKAASKAASKKAKSK